MNNSNINPTIGSVVRVINPYFKSLEDEIDLQVGDHIQIILDDEEYNDGWFYGKNLRSNLIGLFPKCFTDSIEDNDAKESNNSQRIASHSEKHSENNVRKESNNSNHSLYRSTEKRLFSPYGTLNRSHSSFINTSQTAPQVRTTSSNSVNRSLSRLNSKNLSSVSVDQEQQDEMLIQQLMKLCNMDDVLECRNIDSWEPQDVTVFFYNKNIDLDSCLKFYDHKIDAKILFSLTQQDLKNELEILSFGSRFSIVKEIDYLKTIVNQGFSGKGVTNKKSLSSKMNEYDQISASPSMRSSRRSSLLLPAASVRNRSSSQSTNDSVILNNTNMDTLNNLNKNFYNNVERTPSNKNAGYTDASITRNGTQNYRSTSGNMVPTLSVSKRNNVDSTPVKAGLGLNLNFESPRKAPVPPIAPSPISQALASSPDTHFSNSSKNKLYENNNNNQSSDKLYKNGSLNNSSSNMLKKSTSFLQRNLSFRGTPSRSRNITPSGATNEANSLSQPKFPNNMNSYQTPQKADHDFNLQLTPKAAGYASKDIQPQFLNTPNEISQPIYQPPNGNYKDSNNGADRSPHMPNDFILPNKHKKNESGGSFLDLFSKLESMNVNSAVNTPTMASNHRFLQPTKNSLNQPGTADSAATSVYDNRSSVYDAPGMKFGHTRDTSSVYVHSRNNTIGVPSNNQANVNDFLKNSVSSTSGNDLLPVDNSSLTKFNESDETSKDDSFVDFSKDDIDSTLNDKEKIPTHKPLHEINRKLNSGQNLGNVGMTAAEKLKHFKANRAKKVMNYSRTCKDAIKTANVHGWMGKRNSKSGVRGLNTWKRRYFVLTGTRLSYYVDPDNDIKEKGIIDITGYSVIPVNVSADSNKNERFLTFISSTMSTKSNYFFKIVPPKPGSKKNANFTQQKTYYFSVETVEEVKMWMNAMLKATIDIDTSIPIISSCDIPTISLEEAQNLLEKARRDVSLSESHISSAQSLDKLDEGEIIEENHKVFQESEDSEIFKSKSGSKELSLDPFKA